MSRREVGQAIIVLWQKGLQTFYLLTHEEGLGR
jgi:hypothetical protein